MGGEFLDRMYAFRNAAYSIPTHFADGRRPHGGRPRGPGPGRPGRRTGKFVPPCGRSAAAGQAALTSQGVPYTLVTASGTPPSETVNLPALTSGSTGNYNGVVIADSPN